MTFLELQQAVYDRTGASQTPPTEVSRRIKSYLNRWNRKVLSAPLMEPLRRVILTQASVAAQPTYGIAAKSIDYMVETTNQRRIKKNTLGWYRDRFPDPAGITGTPEWYVPLGITRIHTRPANASELFVKSTAAADEGTVRVEAIRSTGYRASLSVALTGTTAVTLSATITDVIDIVDVRLSATQTGVVTLHEDSGAGAELSRIPIGQTVPRFLRYALVPTPASAITYTIDAIADIVDMSNDTDEPFENPDLHDILVDGAVHDEWQMRGRATDARDLRIEIEVRIRQLRASMIEWPEPGGNRERTFEETIELPITSA